MQERLKTEVSKVNAEYDKAKLSVKQYVDGIICDEGSPLSAVIKTEIAEDICVALKKKIQEDEIKEQEFNDKEKELSKKLTELNLVIVASKIRCASLISWASKGAFLGKITPSNW